MLCNNSRVDDAQKVNRSQSRLLSVVESGIERWKFRSGRTDARIRMFKTQRVITIASSLENLIQDETTEDVNACSHKVINDYGEETADMQS